MNINPEQFNKLVLKEDLKDFAKRNELNDKFDSVLNAVDNVVQKLDNIEHAFVSNLAAHDRFEQRISNIEQHLGLNPYSHSIARDKK